MYKHFFFDLDGTLTDSRQPMTKEVADTINELAKKRDVVLISGARESQMLKQSIGIVLPNVTFMGQNGAEHFSVKLTDNEYRDIGQHIAQLIVSYRFKDAKDLIEDRGSQVSFSFIGHHAERHLKEGFDPTGEKRKKVLRKIPFKSKTAKCVIGGTTCFDYIRKGQDKGGCIDRLIKDNGWNKDEGIFFGDAIFQGGNDYTVKRIGMRCVQVDDYKDCIKKLEKFI